MRSAPRLRSLFEYGVLLIACGVGTSSCTTEAACFRDCEEKAPITSGGSAGNGAGSVGGSISLGGLNGLGGLGIRPGDGGVGGLEDPGTACDAADLQTDANNCGECGVHCVITGADSVCVQGKCQIDRCLPQRYDVNGDAADGCELACGGDPANMEECNGEDDNCDGSKDEGFDLTTDIDHCGVCNNACDLQHATPDCVAGSCKIAKCDDGWYSVDGLESTGCEYQCHIKDKAGKDCDPNTADKADGCGVEICDDVDQDCNGQINDGRPMDAGQACSDFCPTKDCLGSCSFGTTQCVGSVLVCVPGATPTLDLCDGKDNDCDGTADENFNFDTDPQHCGDCGTSCVGMFPHAIAKCDQKQCKIDVCETDYGDLDTNAPGCELCPVRPVRSESCNGKDDDCNGVVDDAAAVALTKPATGAGAGVNSYCKQKAGTRCNAVPLVCDSNAGGWLCQYPAGVETLAGRVAITESQCDGIDGNCDGQTDEAFLDLGKTCNDGALGVCLEFGKIRCDPADVTKTLCDTSLPPDSPLASAETCNGLDDNCDGQVDEGTDDMVRITRKSLDFRIDKYEASRPDAKGSASGSDETHVCAVAGRKPWTSATFAEAKGACEASGKRLCTIGELEQACLGPSNRSYPYGNSYIGANCNGIDAAGSATALTGSFPNCVSADGVFDLSGNVAEWSADVKGQTTGNPQYDIMALMGGSYLTPMNGLTCTFDFDVISTNAVLPSLGFRCCKDAP